MNDLMFQASLLVMTMKMMMKEVHSPIVYPRATTFGYMTAILLLTPITSETVIITTMTGDIIPVSCCVQ